LIVAEVTIKPGAIVWVPFPFVEVPRTRERPALVVSVQEPVPGISLLWVLMITSAVNKGWRGDVSLEARFAECGLAVPCIVRTAKIATVSMAGARPDGVLPSDIMHDVRAAMQANLQ
jgi:mRNA interferase MazF